jgi:glutamate dehydrogenase (NAD(P)+)
VHIALAALAHRGLAAEDATAVVQGFGKVGRDAARFFAEAGVRVVAVSDIEGAVHAANGIDVLSLGAHVDREGSVRGFAGADAIDPNEMLELDVDLLVPAAIEGVLHEGNANQVRARIIVEGANGPTTTAADAIFRERDLLVVPDILANAGGVVVSYFEWAQAHQAYRWTEREVEERLRDRMTVAWNDVLAFAAARGVPLRLAATALAVERVTEAHRLRGLYP